MSGSPGKKPVMLEIDQRIYDRCEQMAKAANVPTGTYIRMLFEAAYSRARVTEERHAMIIGHSQSTNPRLAKAAAAAAACRARINAPRGIVDLGIDLKRRPAPAVRKMEQTREPADAHYLAWKLNQFERSLPVGARHIIVAVSDALGIRPEELTGKRRCWSIAHPRQIAMYLVREIRQTSYPEIGRAFGGRDHTTAMHACAKVQAMRGEPAIEDAISRILAALNARYRLNIILEAPTC